ncbi:glucose 1-dehydrogenase [Nocardia puris]|uniref:NAD(P)-dependent dehydrogenase (Short-subunit alcohol dehydrogenase family) n=1 Tax=Nocardia puris TaxID=208602 RepID=A0A366DBL3_9NOCA|nr:glucose 1-dehydrogenase [Nocardia puris]MBF6214507.1 glucose 1-dehydrogenase [Nocardia puris]MBF6365916.1 glucose 1-dehydrogenase [Nocardia puris]MBF6460441.1 glucose 1-dehydrogenase [Nocardia puris]RBO87441.1 NAD(P)-dependent dehydrogenase (short-subunit alcohol dehydrogenase family) [Nocardia puris]
MGNRFDDKIALVTGATSGIGLATARRLHAEGAQVIVTGRDQRKLDATAEELGDRVLAVRGDVADPADLDALTTAIRARFDRLDVLVANAGIGSFQPSAEVTEDEFDRVVGINFKGVFFTVQKALPLLPDHAAIVLNASWALHRGVQGAALYSATKAAVHNLARTLAAELAPRRIRVNSVSPGYIETPSYRENVSAAAKSAAIAVVPAARLGTSEDVAATIAYLASPDAAYVNGQDILVDGGMITAVPETRL